MLSSYKTEFIFIQQLTELTAVVSHCFFSPHCYLHSFRVILSVALAELNADTLDTMNSKCYYRVQTKSEAYPFYTFYHSMYNKEVLSP